jgi:hypothetical protein
MLRAVLSLCLLAGPVLARPVLANPVDCGGNSLSYAEVVTAPRPRLKDGAPQRRQGGGPVEVLPHSLCPDIIERPRRDLPIQVIVDPVRRP